MNRTALTLVAGLGSAVILAAGIVSAAAITSSHHDTARPVVASKPIATPSATPKPKHHHHHHPRVVYVPAAPAAAPAPVQAPSFTNSLAVVNQFYQDITNHDYSDAWSLGGDNIGGSDYNGWAAGYATTASIYLTTSSEWGDGNVQADISALQTDGTVRTYSGTYTVANGVIVSANIVQTG